MPTSTVKRKAKRAARDGVTSPTTYVLPGREWDAITDLVTLFAATGFVANERPQSLLLISEPGSGKTELLDRFQGNPFLQFASDITTRGLFPILKLAKQGVCSHLVASEFQKFFLRKSATAEATLGTLCQAMEEGVGKVLVGDKPLDFGGARLGLIGAITHDTASKWRRDLRELGFWSRAACFEWEMPMDQLQGVMRAISNNDKRDLAPVILKVPEKKIRIDFPVRLSQQFEDYVFQKFREHTILRVFNRFRTLAYASALLDGRESVRAYDIEKVVSFNPYWSRMQT